MARKSQGQGQTLSGSPSSSFTNFASKPIQSIRAPTTADTGYEIGQLWADTSTGIIYGLGAVAAGSATWNLMSPGASDVDTLTGDSGGAISPAGGNITIAGGTNITSAGAGSTITLNLDATVVLATSMSSPIYTVAAATDLNINAVAGQNIIMKMGDAGGVNKVSFVDSASAEVFAIDSNGGIGTLTGLTVTGAFTQTAGIVSISEDNSANAVGIANGTVARAITLGSSAAAHTITIGSATGAASLDLLAGTGNFTIIGAATTTYTLGAAASTGLITLGLSTAGQNIDIGSGVNASAQVITIANGASAANTTLNIMSGIGTSGAGVIAFGNNTRVTTVGICDIAPAAARTVTICGGDGAQNDTLAIMSDNPSANTQTVTVLGGVPTGGTQVLNLLTQTGQAGTVNVATGAAMANTIAIGGTGANVISLGSSQTAGSVDIGAAMTGGTINIGGTGLQVGTVTICGGTGAQIVNLATGGTGIKTVNIGTGAIDNVVTIGTATGAASLDLLCGTGNFTLEGGTASTYDISGTGVNTGTITIGGGTGAQTLNMMNSTGVKTINIGTGAAANVLTIGSTNTTAALTLQAGSGGITATGTFENIASKFVVPTGVDVTWNSSPILMLSGNAPALASGATGVVNLMSMQEGVIMEQFVLGAGQTIIAPVMDATGLLVSGDLTVAEGFEYNFGAALSSSRFAFTIGTSPAFFMEMKYTVADVTGASPYMIGFRKSEANNATLTTYTDYAMIGLDAIATPGFVVLKTELNAGGTTNTDTTDGWVDGASHTVRINVSSAGVVTYLIDGIAPSATAAYTFDTPDVVVPFFRLEHAAVAPGAVHWESMQIGFQ